MKTPDREIIWGLAHATDDADVCSLVNGEDDEATKEARRLETLLRRLVREAGYDVPVDVGSF